MSSPVPLQMKNKNSWDRHVHGDHVERLEHDVRRTLSVGLGVQRSFRERDVMFLGRNQELVVESVVRRIVPCHPKS